MSATVYHNEGTLIEWVPGADAKAGDITFIGLLCGQAVTDVSANLKGSLRVEGVINVPKASGTVLAPGAVTHWNNTSKLAVAATADGIMGKAVGGGANGQTFVLVKLNR